MLRLDLALYYTRLAWRDLVRLWPTTQHQVVIVAGICLPILLLLGLKRGHVADLRRELLTSPSGRQVVFWSAQNGELLDAAAVDRLQSELAGVELIVPEQERVVSVVKKGTSNSTSMTLYSTVAGDPVLRQLRAELDGDDERRIVLAYTVAKQLDVVAGDRLVLKVERRRDGIEEFAEIEMEIQSVLPDSGDARSSIGYGHSRLLDNLEQYVRGFRVEAFQWPALKAPVRDKYGAYLAVCEIGSDYGEADLDALKERGIQATPVEDPEMKNLYGLLKTHSREKLRIYKLASTSSEADPLRRLILSPSDISQMTQADEVIIPWNRPQLVEVDGSAIRLVGVSLPKRSWLRDYFAPENSAFDYDTETFTARPLESLANSPKRDSLRIPLSKDGNIGVVLKVVAAPAGDAAPPATIPPTTNSGSPAKGGDDASKPRDTDKVPKELIGKSTQENLEASDAKSKLSDGGPQTPSDGVSAIQAESPHTVVVPVDMLAQLDAYRNSLADYDPALNMFVPRAESPVYGKARAYASTIDEVPAAVSALTNRGFAVESQNSRIVEIHDQDHSLQILVWVVGIGVFLFGIVTTVSVLTDSTDRKRGTIGILRVMGVSRIGVFYITFLRAAVIGLLAGAAAAAVGYALAIFLGWEPSHQLRYLDWKPRVTVLLDPVDLGMVFLGALLCSGLGALLPAWKASRLDPFEAIVEGRFR